MDTIREAAEVLRRAEQSLRDLLAKAATNGRYDDFMPLGDLAREVAALVAKAEDLASAESPAAVSSDALRSTKPVNGTSRDRPRGKHGYPKFFRAGETIIKIGWSKTAKTEYEHKAPRRVLTHLLATLSKLAAAKKRTTMDDALPLKDPVSGSEIPAYQAYLCLAWLRSVGIVTQHGRQGYSLAKKDDVNARAEECWRQLPTR